MKIIRDTIERIYGDLYSPETILATLILIEENISKEVEEILSDGFQWSDIGQIIGSVVPGLMDVANYLSEKSGKEKKEYVVDVVWVIYESIDPNIPWLPDFIEKYVERSAIRSITEAAVEAVYKVGKVYKTITG